VPGLGGVHRLEGVGGKPSVEVVQRGSQLAFGGTEQIDVFEIQEPTSGAADVGGGDAPVIAQHRAQQVEQAGGDRTVAEVAEDHRVELSGDVAYPFCGSAFGDRVERLWSAVCDAQQLRGVHDESCFLRQARAAADEVALDVLVFEDLVDVVRGLVVRGGADEERLGAECSQVPGDDAGGSDVTAFLQSIQGDHRCFAGQLGRIAEDVAVQDQVADD